MSIYARNAVFMRMFMHAVLGVNEMVLGDGDFYATHLAYSTVLQYRKRGGSGGRIYTFERLIVFIVCVGYNLLVVVPNSD